MSLINDALKRAKQTHRQQTLTPDIVAVATLPPLQPVDDSPVSGPLSGGTKRILLLVPLLFVMGGLAVWFLWQWGTSGKSKIAPALSSTSTPAAGAPVESAKKNPIQITAATVAQVVAHAQAEPDPAPESVAPRSVIQTPNTPPPTAPTETVTASPSASVPTPVSSAPSIAVKPVATSSPAPNDSVPSAPVAQVPISPSPVASPELVTLLAPAIGRTPTPVPPLVFAPPPFKLQGIFYRVKNPTALINDRIVSIGETIDGYRVVQIERQSVKLSVPNYTNVVTLH